MLVSEEYQEQYLEEAKKYIYSINFDRVINKMVSDGWIRSDVLNTCDMFRKFLFLKKKYPAFKNLVPSKDVDEFWHNSILDTHLYWSICDGLFPRDKDKNSDINYLHHYPYFGLDDSGKKDPAILGEAFAATQALYAKEFGEKEIMVPTRSKFPSGVYWLLRKLT